MTNRIARTCIESKVKSRESLQCCLNKCIAQPPVDSTRSLPQFSLARSVSHNNLFLGAALLTCLYLIIRLMYDEFIYVIVSITGALRINFKLILMTYKLNHYNCFSRMKYGPVGVSTESERTIKRLAEPEQNPFGRRSTPAERQQIELSRRKGKTPTAIRTVQVVLSGPRHWGRRKPEHKSVLQ